MSDYGIKSSPYSKDVNKIQEKDLIFSSKFNSLKILKKGIISGTTDGSGVKIIYIPHGLGFSPTFQVFRMGTASWQRLNAASIDSNNYSGVFFPNLGSSNNWVANNDTMFAYSGKNYLYIDISGLANTTYTFLYYIFADLAEDSNSSIVGTPTRGIEVGKSGKDIFQQKPFNLVMSSDYPTLKFIPEKTGIGSISLPLIFGSQKTDPTPEEATYIDIIHGMGYPPFYMGFYTSLDSPDTLSESNFNTVAGATQSLVQCVDSWCDSTRIRFSVWRKASYSDSVSWTANTFTFKYFIFKDNLNLT